MLNFPVDQQFPKVTQGPKFVIFQEDPRNSQVFVQEDEKSLVLDFQQAITPQTLLIYSAVDTL